MNAIAVIVYSPSCEPQAMSVAIRVGAINQKSLPPQPFCHRAVFRSVADFVEFASAQLMGEAFSVKINPEFGKGQAYAESLFDIVNFQVIPHEALDETVRQIQKAVVKMRLGESEPGGLLPDSEDFVADYDAAAVGGEIVYWAEFTPTQVQSGDTGVPSHWGRVWRPISRRQLTDRYFAVIQADTQQPVAGLRSCILIKKSGSDYLVPEQNTCTNFSRFPERCELRLRIAMENYLSAPQVRHHMLKLPLDKNPERRAKLDAIFKASFRQLIKLKLGESAASEFGFKLGEWPFSQAIFAAETRIPGRELNKPAYVIVSAWSDALHSEASELVFTGAVYARFNGRWKALSRLMSYKFPAEALEQCRRWLSEYAPAELRPVPLPVDADAERARRFRTLELTARKAQVLARLGT